MTKIKRSIVLLPIILLTLLVALVFSYSAFLSFFENKVYPGIKVFGLDLTALTRNEAQRQIEDSFRSRVKTLNLSYQNQIFEIDLAEGDPKINSSEVVSQALAVGRTGDLMRNLEMQLQVLTTGKNLTPTIEYKNMALLNFQLAAIEKSTKKDQKDARIILGENIKVINSEFGSELDKDRLLEQFDSYLSLETTSPTTLPTKVLTPKFTTQQAEAAKLVLENLKRKPVKLKFKELEWKITDSIVYSLLNFNDPAKGLLDESKLQSYFKNLSVKIDRQPQDARFTLDRQKFRVKEFQAALDGRKLDTALAAIMLNHALAESKEEVELPVAITLPKTSNEDVNNFGITESIGSGVSYFTGSIPNRIFNLGLAASRINGVLIPPNGVFSFNSSVGDISADSGYKQAYVIKSGRTVLDDGGGVCQVSTTLFRAVLNAGLPVINRTAHAYRVGYYEQSFPPGLDATVFAPSVDFKFKNDTKDYILIQTEVKGASLTIDLYGTKDGRVVALSTPIVKDQSPPPPEVRQDDPTLPKGTVKQVDFPAWGANVSFQRTITKNGESKTDTFRSNYKPWQAIYLVGSGG